MNTNVISGKVIVGMIIVALVGMGLAIAPFSAEAATNTNLSCMRTAVNAREDALIDAFEDYYNRFSTALLVRSSALLLAWEKTDKVERGKAIKAAWKQWKTAKKSAHAELKIDRKAAWTTFKTTAKSTCKEVVPKEEALEKDSSGSIAL